MRYIKKPSSRPYMQETVISETARSGVRQELRGMTYEEGRHSLSPLSEARGPSLEGPAIQMSSQASSTSETNTWEGRLTSAEERSATRYNKTRGFRFTTIKRYQSVVRTLDDGSFGPNTAEAIARFQEENGLAVDGKIGPRTQAAIETNMASSVQPETPPEAEHSETESEGVTSGQLSANFSLAEFASKDGSPTPQSVIPALRQLARQLEVLKAAFGGAAIHVTSGYRSPAHNRRVGGATRSQHLTGRACDVSVAGYSARQVGAKIEELIQAGRMMEGGIGVYSSFVHYDTRGSRARW